MNGWTTGWMVFLMLLAAGDAAAQVAVPQRIWRGGSARSDEGVCSLQLVCWNIERGAQLPAVREFLQARKPAVALLQEVDVHARRTGYAHIAEQLASSLHQNYLFAPEFEELGQGRPNAPAYHGQAILTALPVSAERILRFHTQSDFWQPRWYMPNWSFLKRRRGGRIALVAELGSGPQRIILYNVHLESRGSEERRLRQIEEILADAARYPRDTPMVLAGDMNTRATEAPAVQALLKAGFQKAVGGEITTTHGNALDWIFVRGPLTHAEGQIHRRIQASDHFPLSVQIRHAGAACR